MELTENDLMAYCKLAVLCGILSEAEYDRICNELKARSTKTNKAIDEITEMLQMFNRLPDDILSEEE